MEYNHPQHERDRGSKRYWCHPHHPKPKDSPTWTKWRHEGAVEIGEQESGWPSGDYITVKCLTCGETWIKELPQ